MVSCGRGSELRLFLLTLFVSISISTSGHLSVCLSVYLSAHLSCFELSSELPWILTPKTPTHLPIMVPYFLHFSQLHFPLSAFFKRAVPISYHIFTFFPNLSPSFPLCNPHSPVSSLPCPPISPSLPEKNEKQKKKGETNENRTKADIET